MVFLAITTHGLRDALSKAEQTGQSVWCGSNAISEQQFQALGCVGLTRFTYALDTGDLTIVASAIDTIEQHHPDEIVWVEAKSSKE